MNFRIIFQLFVGCFIFLNKVETLSTENGYVFNDRVIISNIKHDPIIYQKNYLTGMAKFGYSFYIKFNLEGLAGKPIREIINTIGHTENIACRFGRGDKKYPRNDENFHIFLKNSDTTVILIDGILDYKNVLSDDEDIAFQELLTQIKYSLMFIEINVKTWYNYTKIFNHFDPIFDDYMHEFKYFRKFFPHIFINYDSNISEQILKNKLRMDTINYKLLPKSKFLNNIKFELDTFGLDDITLLKILIKNGTRYLNYKNIEALSDKKYQKY